MAALYTNQYCAGQQKRQVGQKTNDFTAHELAVIDAVPDILESWHYVGKQKFVDDMRANNAQIFLDSGAFSAMTLGVTLSISEYCEYIVRNRDILRTEDGVVMASVLDGIGDPLATYRNQLEMEARGVRPLPCFHVGEDERYLEHYIANYEYITIGGMVGRSSKQLMVWLDRIFSKYLTDRGTGRARVKVHGFGITAIPIMEAYPWYSCDSSRWIQEASFGKVLHPTHDAISVSDKSPSRHDQGRHFSTLTQLEQDYLRSEFTKAGFDLERLAGVYQSRVAYNLWAFDQITKRVNASQEDRHRTHIQELF